MNLKNKKILIIVVVAIILASTLAVLGIWDEVVVQEMLTCEWCDGYNDHGPEVTEFTNGQTAHFYVEFGSISPFYDQEGNTVKHEWWFNGVNIYNYEETCPNSNPTNPELEFGSCSNFTFGGVGNGEIVVYYEGEVYSESVVFTVIEEGQNNITCYQCDGEDLVTRVFSGDTCPQDWYPTPPDCEPEPIPGFGTGLLIIALLGLILYLKRRDKK